jgi:hypothetical protein
VPREGVTEPCASCHELIAGGCPEAGMLAMESCPLQFGCTKSAPPGPVDEEYEPHMTPRSDYATVSSPAAAPVEEDYGAPPTAPPTITGQWPGACQSVCA